MKKSFVIVSSIALLLIISISVYFFVFYESGLETGKINLDERYDLNGNVFKSGTFKEGNLNDHIEEFSKINEAGKSVNVKTYFVFINSDREITLSEFEQISQGESTLTLGDSNQFYGVGQDQYREQKIENLEVIINGEEYRFELAPEENAYFVIQ